MSYIPLFHHANTLNALLVGGGKVALKRAKALVKAGASVDVITLVCLDELQALVETHGGRVHLKGYRSELLSSESASTHTSYNISNYNLVLAATNDSAVNQQVAADAKANGALVNVADDPASGDVIFAATVDRQPLTIAVNAGGASPVLSRLLRQQLDQFVPKHYGQLASLVGKYRNQVKQTLGTERERVAFWENVLQGSVAEALFSGQHDQAEQLLLQQLKQKDVIPAGGEVYLIGAGPGDPDLLTLRAFRLLQQADVVLYDALVSQPILDLVSQTAQRIYVGKRRSDHTLPQEGINQLLVAHAKQGQRVARLKGGDPFVFGRGGEEIQTLSSEGIPFQVVPGITAANGCSAYAGIPLTHRDHAQSVRFVTGQLKNGTINLDWPTLAIDQQTLVFYMSLNGLPIICDQLVAHGLAANTPAALVEKGTTQDQRVLVSTLADMPQAMLGANIESPALFIVGSVVSLRNELQWFD